MRLVLFVLLSISFCVKVLPADQFPIVIDGGFSDWENVPVAYTDQYGDAFRGVDFGEIRLTDDDEFFFLSIEFAGELDASENNAFQLFIDTDMDETTGWAVGGIGAELEWNFGSRVGFVRTGGNLEVVNQGDIGFRGGPTVSGNRFEFAIARDVMPDGVNPLFPGQEIRIFLNDQSGGDVAPEPANFEFINYTFDVGELPPETIIALDRELDSDLRILTHNVLFNAPWIKGETEKFGRQWAAIGADIFCFQEIIDYTDKETAALLQDWVPLPDGESWHTHQVTDCVTVSRFPILSSWSVSGNCVTLIDTTEKLGSELLLINAHLPCCGQDFFRQMACNSIMAFILDAKTPGAAVDIAEDTAIVITGDLNLVGLRQQLQTLIAGEITDPNIGPVFSPDWDDTNFTNLLSRQTEKRMGYTWRNDFSSFWPGQLDFFIYSDSVIQPANHYLLYTPEMADPQSLGLEPGDSLSSDHLPFCADFRTLNNFLLGDVNLDGFVNLLDIEPFVTLLTSGKFQLEADINGDGELNLLDVGPFVDLLMG